MLPSKFSSYGMSSAAKKKNTSTKSSSNRRIKFAYYEHKLRDRVLKDNKKLLNNNKPDFKNKLKGARNC